jgi:hypothetical protein
MEAIRSSETSVLTRPTQRNIPEDCVLFTINFEFERNMHPSESGTILAGARGSVVVLRHYATNLKVAGSIPDEVNF